MKASMPPSATALIIGDGAVGVVVAAALARAGLRPGFLGRRGPKAVDAKLGESAPERLAFAAPDPQTSAIAFVAVKAFDLAEALDGTAGLAPGTPVIPLCNGAVESLVRRAAERRPELAWRLGFCTFGVTVLGERHYALRSTVGEVSFGPLVEAAAPTATEAALAAKAPFFAWHPNILVLSRRKWLYNTVINSLAAVRSLPNNGAVLGDLATLAAVFNEAFALAVAMWGPWPVPKASLYEGLIHLVERTAENENSMARDRRLGRRTESEFLAGLATDAARFPLLAGLHRELTETAAPRPT